MSMSYLAERRPTARIPGPSAAGAAYVVAWVVGLAVSPSGTFSTDPADEVAAHLAAQRLAELGQALSVHGLAGVALAVFTAGVATASRGPGARVLGRAGVIAAAISLLQAAIEVGMCLTAGHVAAGTTRSMLALVERLDALKLVALAVVLAAGRMLARRGGLPRWSGLVAGAGSVAMLIAAAGLALGSPGLTTAAAPALVLMLVWVGGVAGTLRRGH
jgi:hypothetical protein